MVLPKQTHKPKLDVVANPRTEKKITPKQEEFCKIYCTNEVTQTEAAVQAGYSKQSAHAIASQLLNGRDYPHVVARITEIKGELARKYEVTFESHVTKLAQLRDAAISSDNFSAAVSAEKYRGQAAGLYIDRKEILHGKIDMMSKEEVIQEIRKLQEEFPGLAAVAEGNVIDGEAVEVKTEDGK
jgi:hypothetical protein|tara:strand:+ start:4656 stop:5207 length:552 start_codon:yes stop_codon:yes gene_type:complete